MTGRDGARRPARRLLAAAGIAALWGLAGVLPAAAQEDFRGLDQGRPVEVVDAYPTEFLEWEVQLGLRGATSPGGEELGAVLELGTGLLPNLEVGFEVEPAWLEDRAGGSFGIHGAGAHLLYNVNHETWHVPAFSFRLEAEAPLGGGAGREEWAWGGRLVATRTLASGLRLHGNAGYRTEARVDGGDAWIGGVALDRPLGLVGPLLVGDVWAEVPADAGRTRVLAELGARFQLTNRTVLDAGLGSRLDRWQDGADVHVTVGLSHSFGVRALTPVPPWPEPSIR